MNKKTAEYLRKLGYLVEENIYQDHKNQEENLSLKELEKQWKESEERKKILTAKFQEISDVELIDELRKRVKNQAIKLFIYPLQEHVFIVAQDATKEISFPLPIEKKEAKHE